MVGLIVAAHHGHDRVVHHQAHRRHRGLRRWSIIVLIIGLMLVSPSAVVHRCVQARRARDGTTSDTSSQIGAVRLPGARESVDRRRERLTRRAARPRSATRLAALGSRKGARTTMRAACSSRPGMYSDVARPLPRLPGAQRGRARPACTLWLLGISGTSVSLRDRASLFAAVVGWIAAVVRFVKRQDGAPRRRSTTSCRS